jgi:hypothetical protein
MFSWCFSMFDWLMIEKRYLGCRECSCICCWRSNYQEGHCFRSLHAHIHYATFVCLSQARTWITTHYAVIFFSCWKIWGERVVFILLILVELLMVTV